MKVQIFYNAKSGSGEQEQQSRALRDYLVAHQIPASQISVVSPSSVAEAFSLAKAASEQQVDLVVVLGGDGTINPIAGGIHAGGGYSTLGIIPAGSVNNLANSLMLPSEAEEAFAVLVNGKTRAIDLCQVNADYMVSSLTLGIMADIAASVTTKAKKRWGKLAFIQNALPILFRNRGYYLTVESHGKKWAMKTRFFLVVMSNSIGGMEQFDPDKEVNDGTFGVYTMEQYSLWRLPHYIWHLLTGGFKQMRDVDYFQTDELVIKCQKKRRFQSVQTRIDGDKRDSLPVHLTLHHKAIKVLVPQDSDVN